MSYTLSSNTSIGKNKTIKKDNKQPISHLQLSLKGSAERTCRPMQCNLRRANNSPHQPPRLLYLVNRAVNSTLAREQNTNSVLPADPRVFCAPGSYATLCSLSPIHTLGLLKWGLQRMGPYQRSWLWLSSTPAVSWHTVRGHIFLLFQTCHIRYGAQDISAACRDVFIKRHSFQCYRYAI